MLSSSIFKFAFVIFIQIILGSCCNKLYVDSSINPINVLDLGAKGDGIKDDTEAFLKAIEQINKAKGGTLVIPFGTYRFASSGSSLKSRFKFIDCNAVTIIGNGSKIEIDGDIHRAVTRVNNSGIKFSAVNQICPFYFENCSDVKMSNIEIDGNADRATRDKNVVEGPNHLIVLENCKNVNLSNLNLHHSLADAIYIGNKEGSENIRLDNIKAHHNARQGISIIALKGAQITNCSFTETGNTEGDYGGHNPMSGLDIEPNYTYQKVEDVSFDSCTFANNIGSQVIVSHIAHTEGVNFRNCEIISNDLSSIYPVIVNARKVTFENCMFDLIGGSIYPTWHKEGSSSAFKDCIIKSDRSGILAVTRNIKSSLLVENCSFIYTGKKRLDTYFPYIRMVNTDFINNEILIPTSKERSDGHSVLLQKIRNEKNTRLRNKENN